MRVAWFWVSGRSTREQRRTWRAGWPFWFGVSHERRQVNGLYLRVGDRWCCFGLRSTRHDSYRRGEQR